MRVRPKAPTYPSKNSALLSDFFYVSLKYFKFFVILSIICIFAAERGLVLPSNSGAFACLDMSKDLMASSKISFCFYPPTYNFLSPCLILLTPPLSPPLQERGTCARPNIFFVFSYCEGVILKL